MLQYKLKHLCSRVIASLSAFGLFSINNSSHAATQLSGSFENAQVGDYFTYTKLGDMTMTANMAGTAGCTVAAGATKIMSNTATVANWVDMSGVTHADVSGCLVKCKAGYYIAGTEGLNGQFYSGIDASEAYALEATDSLCVATGTCQALTNATASFTPQANPSTGTGIGGSEFVNYKTNCTWKCNAGYGAGKTYTATGVGVISTTGTCPANVYKVTFDCGAGATYGSTSIQTGVSTTPYNSEFTIPTTATCKRSSYIFKGWKGSTN